MSVKESNLAVCVPNVGWELLATANTTKAAAATAKAATAAAVQQCTPPVLVRLGLLPLVRQRSRYFDTMLSGYWAEGVQPDQPQQHPIAIEWDAHELKKLIRFIHGGEFVEKLVRCAFFDRGLHSMMLLDPTPARLKRTCA
jgi:hypothetical protein